MTLRAPRPFYLPSPSSPLLSSNPSLDSCLILTFRYIPSTNQYRQTMVTIGTFIFIGSYLIAKMISVSVVRTGSGNLIAIWFAFEAILLMSLRFLVEGEWRLSQTGLDGVAASIVGNICFCLGAFAAPFPYFRFPAYLGGRLWTTSVTWSLVISNPLMLFVGLRMDSAKKEPDLAWDAADFIMGLMLSTVAALIGLVFRVSVNPTKSAIC
mmetsp:Transcript_64000/g.176792  ORF Transcript_64000/g.176792 Transcript_64000/m.176792 type:complete len:210 (+) Transcript_64000:39-668(+)